MKWVTVVVQNLAFAVHEIKEYRMINQIICKQTWVSTRVYERARQHARTCVFSVWFAEIHTVRLRNWFYLQSKHIITHNNTKAGKNTSDNERKATVPVRMFP